MSCSGGWVSTPPSWRRRPDERPRGGPGHSGRDSTAARIIRLLPAQPITSAATIRAAAGSSHQKSLYALKYLEASGVVSQISEGGYDRQYAADGLFALIEAFEARVGMPQARGA